MNQQVIKEAFCTDKSQNTELTDQTNDATEHLTLYPDYSTPGIAGGGSPGGLHTPRWRIFLYLRKEKPAGMKL
jgi:hypothetical protein